VAAVYVYAIALIILSVDWCMSRIMVFSLASDLTGGNYRLLRVLEHFPKEKYIFAMPKDRKKYMLKVIKKYEIDEDIYHIINNAYELKEIGEGNRMNYIKYGFYAVEVAKKLGCKLVYFPHEHTYLPIGLRLGSMKYKVMWTELLQQTPVVGSLLKEGGSGFKLLAENLKIHGHSSLKIIRGYLRLKVFKYAVDDTPVLAVSRSIPYELSKLGVDANIKIVEPGNASDKCLFKGLSRDYDVGFFARVVPEKGIFDFIKSIKILKEVMPNLKVFISGSIDNKNLEKVSNTLRALNLSVELQFNVTREEKFKLLASTKVLLYPTRADAFPTVVLEALSCGTPVVAYGIPAIRFNFDTPAVLKVEPLNIRGLVLATMQILKEGLWESLENEALNFASRFTWDRVAQAEWSMLTTLAKK